ncbi:MAG: hypothetical protein U0974_10375 [Gemmatimonadales bacterium]|nr:hypothetical protein [Gemmatimonadales bacterium]MDZ4390121.1 hypothetical protein [Gemmatimonadales bacterium]
MSDRHWISLPDALAMVKRAQEAPPTLVKGWSIDGAIISEILAQPGARSLRAYLAATEEGVATLVFLGVDAGGRDMTKGVIAEYALPCPPLCDSASPFSGL